MAKWLLVFVALSLPTSLRAQVVINTLCPSVSTQVSTVSVLLTGTTPALDYSQYDLLTNYLTVAYVGGTSQMLTGVPQNVIVGHFTVPWVAVSSYPSALMQEGKSVCPLLSETGTPLLWE